MVILEVSRNRLWRCVGRPHAGVVIAQAVVGVEKLDHGTEVVLEVEVDLLIVSPDRICSKIRSRNWYN